MRSNRILHATGGLLLASVLAAFGGPGTGAEAAGTVAPASETAPVTVDLGGAPTYAPSVYADQARVLEAPAPEPEPAPVTTTTAPPPPPPPPPPPAPAGSLDEIINRYFGPAAGRAKAIAQCESNMNPNAVSPTNDHGLFQINHVHRGQFESVTGAPWSSVYNAELNTKYAKWLYDQQGWSPWVCNRKV